MTYRTYQWQMTVLKGTPHHLGQSQFPLNHLARRKNILRPCEDCSGNRAGGIGIPTPIYLAIATLTNKLLLCTCSAEIKGKDCAKYDEMYHAKSVLWISEITSSPKPLQYKENRTYSSVPCTEVSSLQCYPALQLLHSSEEPWQKLHFVLGSGTVDRQFIQLNPLENFNNTFWCLWTYFMISTA